ncbi:MAG: hypothetical protein EVA81_03720, partial [Proteobacteria bacterium]
MLNFKNSFFGWLKLIMLFALLTFSSIAGYKFYEKGWHVGCFQLESYIVRPDIAPFREDRLQLIALGDTVTGNNDQLEVSQGMAKVCEESGCDLVLLLGDNFYPSGVVSVDDLQFKTKFEEVYGNIKIPFFVVLGNHDVKQDALSQVIYSLMSSTWRMPNYEYSFKTEDVRFFG